MNTQTRNKPPQQQMLILLLVVFVGFVGLALPYPIFPPLFLHPMHGSIVPQTWGAHYRSLMLGVTLAVYSLGQFFGSPILGSLSDRFGRKKILILSLIGTTLGYVMSGLSMQYNRLDLLIVSRLVTGIMEGNIAIARAIAIDMQDYDKHTSLGRINAVSAVGYIVGPLAGGLLADPKVVSWFSFSIPFYCAAIVSVCTIVLIRTLLQETSRGQQQQQSLLQQLNIFHRAIILCRNQRLAILLLVSSLFTIAVDTFYQFGPVYLTGHWLMMPAMIAIYNTILCLGLAIGNGYLASWFNQRYSPRQVTLGFCLLTGLLLLVMAGFPNKTLVYVGFGLIGLTISIAVTSLTVQISNVAELEIQGEVMGTQLGIRMLADSLICLFGGAFILVSIRLPLLIGCLFTLSAMIVYNLKVPLKKSH